mmetsp:Transcript_5136/g.11126  ORF Transcript_5136/g.11126 Transcript_5136/m.11126 type:complete len:87 (+) Transcript_5136:238-498(+)
MADKNLPAYDIIISIDIFLSERIRDGHVILAKRSAYQTYVPNGATNKPKMANIPKNERKLFLNTACTQNGGGLFSSSTDVLLTSFQ